ncbi:hypothetical protein A4A49_33191 [Nicotiana attenuata]|uniref:GAG-pre-integrase domain-containing protein n=1 Tax=Nicotiana attenuata TaxID=49451 RepID=A0A314KP79_NICAT|nr:hypothetical protein A4A49_33191 [Nicotiana attenuata]
MGIGRETDCLYILREAIKTVATAAVIKENCNTKVWHSRLGHAENAAHSHLERNHGDNEDGDPFLLDSIPTPEARPHITNSDDDQDIMSDTSSKGAHLENTADVEEDLENTTDVEKDLANSEANISPNSTDNVPDSSILAEMNQQQMVTNEQDADEQAVDLNAGEQLEELAAGDQCDSQEPNRASRFF